ncbi:hypothetical protein HYR54_06335 [Candidatus Acetothermia bacterium]|nr:hypothetical protein [Candidatus Acetothermia bacterium]
MMKNLIAVLLLGAMGIFFGVQAQAQPDVQPVFSSNSIDGTLLGLEGGYGFDLAGLGIWKPFGGIAYGLDSHKIRHKIGLQIGSLWVSHVDWPSDAVLGREGEMGIKLGFNTQGGQVSLFKGALWQKTGTAPKVGYLHFSSGRTINLYQNIRLTYSTNSLYGAFWPIDKESIKKIFLSSQYYISLSIGQFTFSVNTGRLTNDAGLENFQFVNGMIGSTETLKGERFWRFSVERRFLLLLIFTNLPKPAVLPEGVPWLDELPIQGVLFVEGLNSTHAETGKDPVSENRLGWGVGIVVPTAWFTVQAKIIFDRDGKYTFKVGF